MKNDDRSFVNIDELSQEILSERLNESLEEMNISPNFNPKIYIIYADGKFYYNLGGTASKAKMVMLIIVLAGVVGSPQLADLIQQLLTT